MRLKPHVLYFIIPTLIALLTGGFFLLSFPKDQIHLYINSHHAPFADFFFKYWTHLGEGWLFALAIPLALWKSWRAGFQLAITGLFTLLFSGIFKNWLYARQPRPIEFFKNIADLRLIEGVNMAHWNSFPSGHTTAAFAFWFALALVVKKRGLSLVFFCIAFLVGYSRMYLSQHFLLDVVAGAGLGILAASISYVISTKLTQSFWQTPILKKLF